MSVSSFPYGTILDVSSGSADVDLAGDVLFDSTISPTDAEVGYQLTAGGLERSYDGIGSAYVTINTWLNSGAAADYDCKLTVNSGDTPAGSATGSWLNLGTTRAWTLTDTTAIGFKINNCTIEIVATGTTTPILASATVTMFVEESF